MAIGAKANCAAIRRKKDSPCFHLFGLSLANAFRTLDWEIPNCRAILAGVMPALKAERTAFTWPWVNETSGMFVFRLWELFIAWGQTPCQQT